MELQRVIIKGDLNGLRKLEHQIIEHVNHVYENTGNGNSDYENFSIYQITNKQDKNTALEMLMAFINTCQTAFGDYFQGYMDAMVYPGLVGAVCSKNQAIIDILKTYTDEGTYMDIISRYN